MHSTFEPYAKSGARQHLVVALVNMIISVKPSLRAQSGVIEASFLQSIHRPRFGTVVLLHGKGNQRKETVATCDVHRQANDIDSAIVMALGFEELVVNERDNTQATTKSARGSQTSHYPVLNLKLAVLPDTKALEVKFRVVNGLLCDLVLGQDYLKFQNADDLDEQLSRQWSKRPVLTKPL